MMVSPGKTFAVDLRDDITVTAPDGSTLRMPLSAAGGGRAAAEAPAEAPGLWQVSGRSDLSWEDSVRLDLYYVENWSLTGDLVIMWRTLKVLRNASGAY